MQPQPQSQSQPQQRVRRAARLQAKQATQKSPAPPCYEEAVKKEMRPAPAPAPASESVVAPTRPLKSCLKKPNSANVAAPQKQKRVTWWDDGVKVGFDRVKVVLDRVKVELDRLKVEFDRIKARFKGMSEEKRKKILALVMDLQKAVERAKRYFS